MRERRKRHATMRRARREFAALIAAGGTLVCAPDAYAKLDPLFLISMAMKGVTVRESRYVPPGMSYGIPKPEPMTYTPLDFASDFEWSAQLHRVPVCSMGTAAYVTSIA